METHGPTGSPVPGRADPDRRIAPQARCRTPPAAISPASSTPGRTDARLDAHQLREAPHQQTCAGKQTTASATLDDDEHGLQAMLAGAAHAARPAFPEQIRELAPLADHQRQQSEDDGGERRQREREEHDARVEPHVLHAGKTERDDLRHRAHRSVADEQAEYAARRRQEQALHEQHLQ